MHTSFFVEKLPRVITQIIGKVKIDLTITFFIARFFVRSYTTKYR